MFCDYQCRASKTNPPPEISIAHKRKKNKKATKYKVCFETMSVEIENIFSSFWVEYFFTCS